jgi:hypothetical protein
MEQKQFANVQQIEQSLDKRKKSEIWETLQEQSSARESLQDFFDRNS